MPCTFEHEDRLRADGCARIAGIDEAGRGPLAGPVVAAAVVFPPGLHLPGIDDSKRLSHRVREELFGVITQQPDVEFAISIVSAEEIDRLNILRATHEAMRRAVSSLETPPDHVLIDGLPVKPFPIPQTAIIKGDGCSVSIAAASILAKVTRDRIMAEAAMEFPAYGFDRHRGYATAQHLAMLDTHGPCRLHRRTFAPVLQTLLPL